MALQFPFNELHSAELERWLLQVGLGAHQYCSEHIPKFSKYCSRQTFLPLFVKAVFLEQLSITSLAEEQSWKVLLAIQVIENHSTNIFQHQNLDEILVGLGRLALSLKVPALSHYLLVGRHLSERKQWLGFCYSESLSEIEVWEVDQCHDFLHFIKSRGNHNEAD
jgi:hypothetical protein